MNAPSPDELDAADMQRLVSGHDAALNELMARHGEKLFHFLIRGLQNEAEAADLAQEAFVRVYQHRAKFDASQKFSTWLYTIAANLDKDRYRWRSRHPQVSLDVENEQTGDSLREHLPAPGPTPSDCLQADERADAVRRAVAALPEDLRTPLTRDARTRRLGPSSVARSKRWSRVSTGRGSNSAPEIGRAHV